MQIGCHGSVWTGRFDDDGLRDAIERTAAAGFDLIEIPLMDTGLADPAVVRGRAEAAGLAVTASLGLSEDTDISSEHADVHAAGVARLLDCVEFLAEAGGTHLVGVIYCAMGKYTAPARELNWQRSADGIARVAQRGQELGVRVGLEVVNRYESNMLNTGRQASEFVDRVREHAGTDNVDVHLDTYHMNIEEPDMFFPVLDAGDRLGYVHIGESHRGYLGSGTVDFDSFFRALGRLGYDGPVVFESFSSVVVHPQMSSMLAIWRNLWSDGDDLAAHANRFIRGRLAAVGSIAEH